MLYTTCIILCFLKWKLFCKIRKQIKKNTIFNLFCHITEKKHRKTEYLAMLLLNWSSIAFFFNQTGNVFFLSLNIKFLQQLMDLHYNVK